MTDIYQERYLAHQKRKAKSLTSDFGVEMKPNTKKEIEAFFKILERRRSQRAFNREEITEEELSRILTAIDLSPSSCSRRGVGVRIITDRDDKDLLSGLLVGGVGWCHRGQVIILLIADMLAYKNPAEKDTMPYLDAGVVIQTAYLSAEALNIGCCYINPNVREKNEAFFKERFGIGENELFCGAVVIGKYNKKHI